MPTDYPQAGSASVSVSGALIPGSDISAPGAPPLGRSRMNSYFFLPPGFEAGVSDGGTPVQGMGVKRMSRKS